MNELLYLLEDVVLASLLITIFIMVGFHYFVKKYGGQLYDTYIKALDNKWFHALNVILLIALGLLMWYGIIRAVF